MKRILHCLSIAVIISLAVSGCCMDQKNQKAKYIFLFIGDGMGHGQVALAESYLSYKADKFGGERLTFTEFPYLAMAETHTANRYITCSAAAGTAIACGVKANNSTIGLDSDGNPATSVAQELHDQGYKVGILTTVPFNHATPAAFYGHNSYRENYYDISLEIPASGFEFFGGAGLYGRRGRNGDLKFIDEYLEENGHTICYGPQEFKEKSEGKEKVIFMQNSARKDNLDYYDANGNEEGDISLKEMLDLCIDHLGDDEPFFIMCEGGEIDWAAHENLVMPMVQEILNFDEVIQTAVEFYKEHPEETLIIVTGDHETGGPTIGEGVEWREEFIGWQQIEKNWIESGCRNNLSYEENKAMNSKALIGWTSCHHTGAPVPVYAIGKGAEKFHGRIDNTDIKGIILGE